MERCSFIEAQYTRMRAVYWDECGELSWTASTTGQDERDRLGRVRQTGTKAAKLAVIQ